MKRRRARVLAGSLAATLGAGLPVACSGGGGSAAADVTTGATEARPDTDATAQQRPAPGQAWVIFGADTVQAEVASTPSAREQGLMGRENIPAGTGMLFVFPDTEHRSFWMKDTYVDLDIGFFNEGYELTEIKQMTALDTSFVDSGGPVTFALEVMQGWFEERGIEVGTVARVIFGPGLRVS